jgi:hypothetical protein
MTIVEAVTIAKIATTAAVVEAVPLVVAGGTRPERHRTMARMTMMAHKAATSIQNR